MWGSGRMYLKGEERQEVPPLKKRTIAVFRVRTNRGKVDSGKRRLFQVGVLVNQRWTRSEGSGMFILLR